ncbi:MAG: hypothetical protein GC191_04065 [Azospirillum sp.]|nr:hypothetical protein [Azospirillum sp.]
MAAKVLAAVLLVLAGGPAVAGCPQPDQIDRLAADVTALIPARGFGPGLSLADGACARDQLVARLTATLGGRIGYKAGLTNAAVQRRFGVDQPVRGILLEKMILADGATVPARFGARPVFEADLIAVVGDEGINQAATPLEALSHLRALVPFIELPDLVLAPGEPLDAATITAINVGARLGVAGVPITVAAGSAAAGPALAGPALVDALAAMTVTIGDDSGAELARSSGSAILGQPLEAVLWLARDVARGGGVLKRGDRLSLGSFGPLLVPVPGRTVTVRYLGLPGNPAVSVRFE